MLKSKLIIKIFIALSGAAIIITSAVVAGTSYRSDTATCDEIGSYSVSVEDKNDEIEFLKLFNHKPIADSRQRETVTIPTEFNSVYEEYNELQKKIGLDLNRNKGAKAEKISYRLENNYYAVILISDGRIIGGHITNGEWGSKNMPLTEE